MRLLVPTLPLLIVLGCTTRVVVVWPDKPLEVKIANCPVDNVAPATDAGGAAQVDPDPPPPSRAKLTAAPVKLTDKGTLVFVEHAPTGGGGNGVTVFEASGTSDGACAAGQTKRILWRIAPAGRWDAQIAVDAGKTLCAEPTGGFADGDVTWSVR